MAKLRVGLLYGGRSVEHEVSIASATSIMQSLDPSRYEVIPIAVDHAGRWHLGDGRQLLGEATGSEDEVLLPANPGDFTLIPRAAGDPLSLDVILPIIHGRGGEDGALQGLLELAGVAYVGSGVLSSAVQMDKDVAKRLLQAAGLPVLPWIAVRAHECSGAGLDEIVRRTQAKLTWPVFVKPANSGSSVGIHRVETPEQLCSGLQDALRYDRKLIIEQGLDAREVEVAVLGNESPQASVPGEIRTSHPFYDYESKYHDESTTLIIPADLEDSVTEQLRSMALDAYQTLEAEGLARVDFLIDRQSGDVYINELNSLPGFTDGSMYPKMWEATGLSYPMLLDRLIELAIERHHATSALETSFRQPAPIND